MDLKGTSEVIAPTTEEWGAEEWSPVKQVKYRTKQAFETLPNVKIVNICLPIKQVKTLKNLLTCLCALD